MRPQELRIGNLIKVSWKQDPYYVTGDILYEMDEFEHCYSPIPLTEEWLVKFGFDQVEESGVFDIDIDGDRYLSVNDMQKKCYVGASIDWTLIKCPESVHQLQNLFFALTGEELCVKQS